MIEKMDKVPRTKILPHDEPLPYGQSGWNIWRSSKSNFESNQI